MRYTNYNEVYICRWLLTGNEVLYRYTGIQIMMYTGNEVYR